jgi:hypothetical protein
VTEWIKSSFCQNSACIEVSRQGNYSVVLRTEDDFMGVTMEEWDAFVKGAKAGEFDHITNGEPVKKAVPKKVTVFYNDKDITQLQCSEFIVLEGAVWLKGMLGAGMAVTDEDILIPFSSIKKIQVT